MYEEQKLFEFVESAVNVLIGTGNTEGEFVGPFVSLEVGMMTGAPGLLPNKQLVKGRRVIRWIAHGTEYLLFENGVFFLRHGHENEYHYVSHRSIERTIQQLLELAILERNRVFPVIGYSKELEKEGSGIDMFLYEQDIPE